jgi:hydroxymethylbilane synthase
MSRIRIATRGSDLALAQAHYVAGRIRTELHREAELVVVKTTGDRIQNVSLAKIGGKGLFVKEIEEALLAGRADVAIHSAKDLPARIAPGLCLSAFPERADPRDALVTRQPGLSLETLPRGARVGTGSTRRTSQLLAGRPDLEVVPLRGNVPTRLGRLETDRLDAVILACAGLDRLHLSEHISERVAPERMLPAVCQGMLALEVREDDALTRDLVALDGPGNAILVAAERSFLRHLEGDCTIPLAGFCEPRPNARIRLRGLVASLDGRELARGELEGPATEAEDIGRRVAEQVLAAGGEGILARLRCEAGAEEGSA